MKAAKMALDYIVRAFIIGGGILMLKEILDSNK